MKRNLLLAVASILLLSSCGQVPEEPLLSNKVSTEDLQSETPLPSDSSSSEGKNEYVDEEGVKRVKFDESKYEAHKFFELQSEEMYLIPGEKYTLPVMLKKGESLDNLIYNIETPDNIKVSEDGVIEAITNQDLLEVVGKVYVHNDKNIQTLTIHVVDYYEFGSYFTMLDKGFLYNKNVIFFGDSLSHNWYKYPSGCKPVTQEDYDQMQKAIDEDVIAYPKQYITLLRKACNLNAVNAAWSGGTMAYLPKSQDRLPYKSLPGAIKDNEDFIPKADVAFVFYGTNDLSEQVPIGRPSDKFVEGQECSFTGSMQYSINELRKLNPDINIIFMNLMTRTYSLPTEITIDDYNNAIYEVSKANSCKMLDINSLFTEKEFALFTTDGLHLNENGYAVLTEYILSGRNIKNEYI